MIAAITHSSLHYLQMLREAVSLLEGSRSMFGHHKLYHEGAMARGVIIRLFAEREHHTVAHYDVMVDVEFDDGTHGHFQERLKHADVGDCQERDVLPVRYDPRDRSKLVVDLPALEASKYMPKENVGGQSQLPQFPAGGAAGAGTLGAIFGGGSMADIIREARRDPQGLRDRLIAQAQAAGAQVFVTQSGGIQAQPYQTPPVGDDGLGAEPSLETDPSFAAQPQFAQEQFQQVQFEQAQFQAPVQFETPVQYQAPVPFETPVQFETSGQLQAPVQSQRQVEPGDFDPNEEF
jgi:hypothetical protein